MLFIGVSLDLPALAGGAVGGGGGKNRLGDERPGAGAGAGAGEVDVPGGVDGPAGLVADPLSQDTCEGVTGDSRLL